VPAEVALEADRFSKVLHDVPIPRTNSSAMLSSFGAEITRVLGKREV
jgi:hypothetical protein